MKTDWSKLCFPRLCGLLAGNPSRLSQALHNAGFKALNLDFTYSAFPTTDTEQGLKSCRELGFRGLSLTIPHKEAALNLVDTLSLESKKIGSINTVINDGEHLHGFNTDHFGITEALKEVNFLGKEALIIGAGGASRGALFALQSLGVSNIKICNRTAERAQKLAQEFTSDQLKVDHIDFNSVNEFITKSNLLILNSTPAGDIIDFAKLNSTQTVFDMVTSETALIKAAKEKGAIVVPGIRMLLHQALKQFELFTEQKAPKLEMENALIKEYQSA